MHGIELIAVNSTGYVLVWMLTSRVCYLRWRKRKIKSLIKGGRTPKLAVAWYEQDHSNQKDFIGDKTDHAVGAFFSGLFWPVTLVFFTVALLGRGLLTTVELIATLISKGGYDPTKSELPKPDYAKIHVLEGEIFPQDSCE